MQNNYRRKSSLVASEAPPYHGKSTRKTECFVHQLLQAQRSSDGWRGDGSLEGISEQEPDMHNERAEPRLAGDGAADQNGDSSHISPNTADAGEGKAPDEKSKCSRLLTKKQLGDLAWDVRQLSKKLGTIRTKLKVKNVFLLTKVHDETLIENTREIVRWLLSAEREVKYTVYVEETLQKNKKFSAQTILDELEKEYTVDGEVRAEWKAGRRLKYWSNEMCRSQSVTRQTFDFVVTLGGDGTVLYASWLFQRIVPPTLSFALGSLGFLTKFDFEEYEATLTKAFTEGVTISLRLRFEGTVMRSQKRKKLAVTNGDGEAQAGEEDDDEDENAGRDLVEELVGEEMGDERTHRPDKTFEILNDIVVDRGPSPSKLSHISMTHATY